jgi:(1->4)-alpha-D-glucan 1-alpha-D-glucosylmutase
MSGPRIPVSTYRLQFNQHLRFNDAKDLVAYLHELGITDLYASPLLQAKRGSMHGYDVADPSHLNSELGSDEEFDGLVRELQRHDMGLLLDIVPNHMAATSENPWWMDLLEDGPRSAFASHFDVDWHPPSRSLENRVLLPILGRPYAQALEGRELRLTYGRSGFFLNYFDFTLPIATRSYGRLLGYRQDRLKRVVGSDAPTWLEFQGILAAITQIPSPGSAPAEAPGERRQHREAVKERLWSVYTGSPEVKRFVDGNVRLFNGRKGVRSTFVNLLRIVSCKTLSHSPERSLTMSYPRKRPSNGFPSLMIMGKPSRVLTTRWSWATSSDPSLSHCSATRTKHHTKRTRLADLDFTTEVNASRRAHN